MGTMIDDELHPRPVKITAEQAAARRAAAQSKLGVALEPSQHELTLRQRTVDAKKH
ncbi:hypothetical protein ACWDTP_32385 [Mycobacterium sp. NPDC003449]